MSRGVPGGVFYVTAVCVNSVIGRTEGFWSAYPGAPATVMAPVTERRQCFLARVSNYPPGFASLANYVRVYKQSGSWKLSGKLESIFGPGTPIPVAAGYATAVCIDLPPGFFASSGERAATPPTSIAADLGRTACGLTGVRGRFSVNNTIQLTMPPSKPGEWTIRVTEGNIGEYACMARRRYWGTLP